MVVVWVLFAPAHYSQAIVVSTGIPDALIHNYQARGRFPVSMLSYNVFLRPPLVDAMFLFRDHAVCRAPLIGRHLKAALYDIVALQETQHGTATMDMLQPLLDSYPYRVLRQPEAFAWDDTRAVDGGVSLLSRYPIEKSTIVAFDACSAEDCLARKGFVHALIRLSETLKINVIATHANSGRKHASRASRTAQLKQLHAYIDSVRDFGVWPTFILGDVNVDSMTHEPVLIGEYDAMFSELKTKIGQPIDAVTEFWKGARAFDELTHTRNCTHSRVSPCESPNAPSLATERGRMDYVMYYPHKDYHICVERVETLDFADPAQTCDAPYLSDHKALGAQIEITLPGS